MWCILATGWCLKLLLFSHEALVWSLCSTLLFAQESPSLNGNDKTTHFNRAPSNLIAFIIPASTTTSTTAVASSVYTQSPSLPLQKQPVLGLPSILRKPVKNDEALSEFLKQVDQLEQQQQEEIARNIVPATKDPKLPKVFRKGERYCCGFCTFSSVFEHMFEKHLKYRHRFLSQQEYCQALESQREKNRKQSWAPEHEDLGKLSTTANFCSYKCSP